MATTTDTGTEHPLLAGVRALRAQVAELSARPAFALDPEAARVALVQATGLVAQVAELELKLATHADTARCR